MRGSGKNTLLSMMRHAVRSEEVTKVLLKWDEAEMAKSHGPAPSRTISALEFALKYGAYCEDLALNDPFQEAAYAAIVRHALVTEARKGEAAGSASASASSKSTSSESLIAAQASAVTSRMTNEALAEHAARARQLASKMDQIKNLVQAPGPDPGDSEAVVVTRVFDDVKLSTGHGSAATARINSGDWFTKRWFTTGRSVMKQTWKVSDKELGSPTPVEKRGKHTADGEDPEDGEHGADGGDKKSAKKKRAGSRKSKADDEAGGGAGGTKRKRVDYRLTEEEQKGVVGSVDLLGNEKLDSTALAAIMSAPVGQLITFSTRPYTRIVGKYVYKGPLAMLSDSTASVERLKTLAGRYQLFKAFGCIMPDMAYVPEADNPHMVWIRTVNIATTPQSEWKATTSEPSRFNPYPKQVLDRGSMGVRTAYDLTEKDVKEHPTLVLSLLRMLVARWVAKPPVGDTQMRNILVAMVDGKPAAYNTDYEDNRAGFTGSASPATAAEHEEGAEEGAPVRKKRKTKANGASAASAEDTEEKPKAKAKGRSKKAEPTESQLKSWSWSKLLFTKQPPGHLLAALEEAMRTHRPKVMHLISELRFKFGDQCAEQKLMDQTRLDLALVALERVCLETPPAASASAPAPAPADDARPAGEEKDEDQPITKKKKKNKQDESESEGAEAEAEGEEDEAEVVSPSSSESMHD